MKLTVLVKNTILNIMTPIPRVSGTILSSMTPRLDLEDIVNLDGLFQVKS